ncbi:MAG TPA: hypothetical protein VN612_00965 [Acidobacteriaceae bacterium]|nr:hypothetical protein [Acidobacteriaceae bacterium]
MDYINEIIERFLVALGLTLSRMSEEETGMITLLLVLLVVAAAATHILRAAYLGQ